jgi:hypothetical protein
MKLNRIITLCAVTAALAWSVSSAFAQDNGGNGGGNNGGDQQGQGGGLRRFRNNGDQGGPGGGGRGNWDPAQMQQRMMDGIKDRLEFTNDTDWTAVQPLVQKVLDARRDVGNGGMRAMFGGRNRNNGDQGGNNRRGGMFGTPSAEETALQDAIDNNAPAAQIKDLLAKYRTAQKAKQAKLEAAQADLKKVLSTKQEAQAAILGLVN